jgi:hypothetical protein
MKWSEAQEPARKDKNFDSSWFFVFAFQQHIQLQNAGLLG